MEDDHAYSVELAATDPQASQPDAILIPLKPHQRAALYKAKCMESGQSLRYRMDDPARHIPDMYSRTQVTFRGTFDIECNMGILGDIVGYGKTLTALAIIAATPVHQIHNTSHDVYSYHDRHYAYMRVTCPRREEAAPNEFIYTTLAVVPRGPVFVQWANAIREQTTLRLLVVESVPQIRRQLPPQGSPFHVIKEFFERYDIVLIKSTTLKGLMDHYDVPYQTHPLKAWGRIMVDEAHDILNKVPLFSWKFLWLISGTYPAILATYGSRHQLPYGIRELLTYERINLMLIKGQTNFVTQSFTVPQPFEHWYLCHIPQYLVAIQPFLSPNVQERINANDIAGAVRELGGKNETEDDILDLLTREIKRDIRNKEHEISYVENLEMSEDTKAARLVTLRADLTRLQDRYVSLTQRVSQLSEKPCPVCMENFTNPIVLPCTHVVCGSCLLQWMNTRCACPECRTPVQSQKLIAIVKQKTHEVSGQPVILLSKEDTLLKILHDKPHGRFLVFSRCDSTFTRLTEKLIASNISHAEIKGSTPYMMKLLERFRDGQLRVILLNTHHAGSGIDISCATDVVIFHSMGLDKMQAVGRAQRVGRTVPLHIHNLCYPNEMDV